MTIVKRSFAQALDSLRRGAAADELDKALRHLVLECTEQQRGGALMLTIKVKPNKNGSIELTDSLKVKAPEAERVSTILYATPEGHLQRNDPRQGDLEGMRAVEPDTREVRSVGQG